MKMRNYFVCALAWILISCSDTKLPEPNQIGFSYFPLEIGDFRSYQVSKITYSLFAATDTSNYQLKQLVVDTFSTLNQINYVLHRFSREKSSDSWQLDSVWTTRRTQNHAIVVENNIPFVKMVFPVRQDKIWDGNLFNALPIDEYQVTEIGGTLETPAGTFVDNLTIFENYDPDTLIFQDIRQSVYASNIGLVYKYSNILDFCNTTPGCLGTLEFGTKFEQVLIDYGEE